MEPEKKIQRNIVRSYVKIQEESDGYDPLSRKIVNRLNIETLTQNVFNFIDDDIEEKTNERDSSVKLSIKEHSSLSGKPLNKH